MEQVAFILRIDPENIADYKDRHDHVYPELEEQFKLAGIETYQIFHHEGTLFAFMRVEDYKKAMNQIGNHPANARWSIFMADLLLPWENGKKTINLEKVYDFNSTI